MRKFIVIPLLLFMLLAPNSTFAQDESEECYFELEDESYLQVGAYGFEDCTELLLAYGISYEYGEAYGWWGDFYTYVGETGDVYYLDEDEEWVYWGTVDVVEEESLDTNTGSTGTSSSLSLYEIFELAEYDINAFWEAEFEDEELDYYRPEVVIIEDGDMNSDCGYIGDSTGPVYCTADNTIYLNIAFMEDQYYRIGDYSVVIVMAHEWGHAVENHLGYFDGEFYSITTELMADCFAGAYTYYLMNESENAVLEVGDIDEAVTSLFESGDNLPWFDEQAHGTGQQRIEAFQLGMNLGGEECLEIEFE